MFILKLFGNTWDDIIIRKMKVIVICCRYITIDKMYGHMLPDGTRDFITAQSWVNIIESTTWKIT